MWRPSPRACTWLGAYGGRTVFCLFRCCVYSWLFCLPPASLQHQGDGQRQSWRVHPGRTQQPTRSPGAASKVACAVLDSSCRSVYSAAGCSCIQLAAVVEEQAAAAWCHAAARASIASLCQPPGAVRCWTSSSHLRLWENSGFLCQHLYLLARLGRGGFCCAAAADGAAYGGLCCSRGRRDSQCLSARRSITVQWQGAGATSLGPGQAAFSRRPCTKPSLVCQHSLACFSFNSLC